jgi:hypothetical protein
LYWRRLAGRLVGSRGRAANVGFVGTLLVTVVVLSGGAFATDPAALDAQEYSPYSDPEKPVLSVLLSDPRNVEDFRREFGLGGEEMEAVLAATREENRKLAEEHAQSERLVAANKGMTREGIENKISASDYEERVEAAISDTKATVEGVVAPDGGEARLREWTEAKFVQARQEFSEEASADYVTRAAGSRKLRCKVFATQYHGYTGSEAALPHRKLKFGNKPKVRIRRVNRARVVKPRVKEVGPWNTYDNYWAKGKHRMMWKSLPRCKPEAQAAYFKNFNKGRDEFGRKVLNPAGVDLTPRVARKLGLKKYQNAWVYVRFPWVRR